MYSVVVVDDEPAAREYIKQIITKHCLEFCVIAEASDGNEALELTKEHQPDVLVFDIRMPGLDGLELVAKVIEEDKPPIMVAVSGYSKFEYARKAMQGGVIDYLLKPVLPKDVSDLFNRIGKLLKQGYHEQKVRIVRQIYQQKKIREEELKRNFRHQEYHLAITRHNGLFQRLSSIPPKEISSEWQEQFISYGRDEKENLYIIPTDLINEVNFQDIIKHQITKESDQEGYRTTILTRNKYKNTQLPEIINQLYTTLDQRIVLGKTQMMYLEDYNPMTIKISKEEKRLNEDLKYYFENRDYINIKGTMKELINLWINKEQPLILIAGNLRGYNHRLQQLKGMRKYDLKLENMQGIEDVFTNVNNKEQLMKELDELLFEEENYVIKFDKLDTDFFISEVSDYIEEKIYILSGVQDVVKKFGVSQTYLGSLFRKYKGMSVNTFITNVKMERAKKLLEKENELLIRDISERLGYRDQFYFSRVFRAYTGMPPSDYVEMQKKETKCK